MFRITKDFEVANVNIVIRILPAPTRKKQITMVKLVYGIITFFLCLGAGFLAIRLAPALGLLDMPGGRRQHGAPVPRVGGIAIIMSLLAISVISGYRIPLTALETGCVLCMALIGLVDDCVDLRARWKAFLGLIVATALATGAMHHLGPHLATFEILGLAIPPVPWLAFFLLVLLFWSIPQAFNLIDGANGLAMGFGLVVVGSLWAAGVSHPMVGGALLACLALNWPKSRLFLGDCGSLSIGLLLIIYAQKAIIMPYPNHLIWLFAYPMIDVLTVITIRTINRQPIFRGDRSHLHFQIGDRWPFLAHVSVPLLLIIAAMCGSEIYLSERWALIPYAGLALLFTLSGFFILASVAAWRRATHVRVTRMEKEESLFQAE